jgi:hypothetical protein
VRNAPGRNDPDFEENNKRFAQPLFTGWRRLAVLVKTATGKLQAERFARTLKEAAIPFTSESEALAYLNEADANTWFTVQIDDAKRIVRYTRTNKPLDFDSPEFKRAMDALVALAKSDWALLDDMRAAVGRNDPDYETKTLEVVRRIYAGWGKVAVLMKSATGALQAERVKRANQLPSTVRVFNDEESASRWLQG